VLATIVLPILANAWGLPLLLAGLALACVVAAVITDRLRIEPTGQSLEAVQDGASVNVGSDLSLKL